ncbi:hypothetical protein K9N68_25105 [Kovacikia minuta CCNUW1]|uniref:hypothetical protein n=1 Tax=Kovacikia minuta TaxID=2931930 RepID=UPI001CCE5147|nr:hypothetical protein [Kovacikia minuta]UBF24904.1 hypothetical protein K9N68_25105 [Kovacikia minuta CCNUW1]
MVGSVERIERDLAVMDEAIAALAQEFHAAYSNYLNGLGQAVRQQLVLASFHVCTQGYPEQFLNLSYNQRQQLQKMLRTLAHQTQEELLAQLHIPVVTESPEAVDLFDEINELEAGEAIASLATFETSPLKSEKNPQRLTPIHLAQWQQDLERAIAQELQTASHAANRLLQQAGVLPRKLPEPLLEAASRADAADIGGSTPNLMNLLVEAAGETPTEKDRSDESRKQSIMHIVAINLRLPEIEFANASLTAARSQIRTLLSRLKTLGRDYQKKQRERAIAEAQDAWRASWTED